jgi:DNA-binding NtrC family response regulator
MADVVIYSRRGINMATILVVDDQANARKSLKKALEIEGHKVVTAGSLKEAENSLGRAPIDILILDLLLPGEDSLGFIAMLKRRRMGVSVIAVSGDEQHLKAASVADVRLAKPLRLETVIAAVAHLSREG